MDGEYPLAERRELAGERDEHLLRAEAAGHRAQWRQLRACAPRAEQVTYGALLERRALRSGRLGGGREHRAVAAHSTGSGTGTLTGTQQTPRVVQLPRELRMRQLRLENRRIRELLLEARLLLENHRYRQRYKDK